MKEATRFARRFFWKETHITSNDGREKNCSRDERNFDTELKVYASPSDPPVSSGARYCLWITRCTRCAGCYSLKTVVPPVCHLSSAWRSFSRVVASLGSRSRLATRRSITVSLGQTAVEKWKNPYPGRYVKTLQVDATRLAVDKSRRRGS